MTIKKSVANAAQRVLLYGDFIWLVKNAFAYCFKKVGLSTTRNSDKEHNKYVGQVSTLMTPLKSKDGGLLSHFDEIEESHAEIKNTSLIHLLVKKPDIPVNESKIKGQLPWEILFGFCRTYKKISEQLGFHLILKTVEQQDINYKAVDEDIKVSFGSFPSDNYSWSSSTNNVYWFHQKVFYFIIWFMEYW